jgi:AraC-like DNA-binding protein
MVERLPISKAVSAVGGTIVYPPGGCYGPRHQADVQIVFLHTGHMTVAVDGESFHLAPGHAALLKPGHQELFEFAGDQETWHRWIAVHFDTLTADQTAYLDGLPFSIPISEELNRIMDLMLSLKTAHHEESDVMRTLGLAALSLYAYGRDTPQIQEVHPSVWSAKTYIHEHYAEEITLHDLSVIAGISPEYLVRLFRDSEKITPIKYLWRYRVRRAIELLTQTGLSITEIAARSGFKTTYHFARSIKEQTGKTPTDIRTLSWGPAAKPYEGNR